MRKDETTGTTFLKINFFLVGIEDLCRVKNKVPYKPLRVLKTKQDKVISPNEHQMSFEVPGLGCSGELYVLPQWRVIPHKPSEPYLKSQVAPANWGRRYSSQVCTCWDDS